MKSYLIFILAFNNTFLTKLGVINYANLMNKANDDVCDSDGCLITASILLEQIDRTVSPCEDFYQFACGSSKSK